MKSLIIPTPASSNLKPTRYVISFAALMGLFYGSFAQTGSFSALYANSAFQSGGTATFYSVPTFYNGFNLQGGVANYNASSHSFYGGPVTFSSGVTFSSTATYSGVSTFAGSSTFSNSVLFNSGLSTNGNVTIGVGSAANSANCTNIRYIAASDAYSTTPTPFFRLTTQFLVGAASISPLLTATHKGIGIRNDSPQYPLDVSGSSRFQGPIYLESYPLNITNSGILIKAGGIDLFKVNVSDKVTYVNKLKVTLTNPFPDYVFKKDYKLLTLKEVEQFVSLNQHLPNIQSAEEYSKQEGVDVGELQIKLLEKIEELTLYIIQQQKEIEALKSLYKGQ